MIHNVDFVSVFIFGRTYTGCMLILTPWIAIAIALPSTGRKR